MREDAAMRGGDFIGREHELAVLQRHLEATAGVAAGRPTTVLLEGDAGVGKSRLLTEFADRNRGDGVHVLRGACIDLGGGAIPYAPLIEALRLMVRTHGEAGARDLAGSAWDELGSLISDFTGTAAGDRPGGESGSRLRVFGPVLRLLDHLGARATVLLIFEDVHVADQSTLDLVSYLTRVTAPERTLLVCSGRPVANTHPLRALLAEPDFARRAERLQLRGLAERELGRFLNQDHFLSQFGPAGRDLVRRGHEMSEGNPFLAEQLLRSGMLARSGRIPPSISDLMLPRVRGLSREANRVLRVAATAARRVSDQLLAAVCKLEDDVFDEALLDCLNEGMLVADPADDTYTVRHALLREAIYERLLIPRERRRLHTEMAEAITADPGLGPADELSAATELAHHWFCAGRAPQALAAAVHAGDLAVAVRAFREAETHYMRALDLWEQVPNASRNAVAGRDRLLVAAADAARWSGHVDEAVRLILEVVGEVDPVARPQWAGELYERLGSFQWEAGAYEQSAQAYAQADKLLADRPPDAARARVLAGLAMARLRAGGYREGLDLAREAARMAEEAGALLELGRALNAEGLALTMIDRADEGLPLLRRALQIAEGSDHLEDLFRAYGNLGVALEHVGDLAGAVEVERIGLSRIRKLGLVSTRQMGVLANNAGASLFLLGRWDEAVELLDEMLEGRPSVRESAYLRLTRAEIDVAQGRFAAARERIEQVQGLPNADPRFLGALHAAEAELLLWRGEPDLALATVDRGLVAVGGTQSVLERLRLYAVGLRAVADRHAGGQDADTAERSSEFAALAVQVGVEHSAAGETQALLRQCAAERDRALDTATEPVWEAVAQSWEGLGRRYRTAYARLQQAAACVAVNDHAGAARAAADAAETAERLAAEPLLDAVHRLLRPAGIDLSVRGTVDADESASTAERDRILSLLTPREQQVSRLLARARTNRQIARELKIAEDTAGVHVSNIFKKLKVGSRAEAALLLVRLGVFDD